MSLWTIPYYKGPMKKFTIILLLIIALACICHSQSWEYLGFPGGVRDIKVAPSNSDVIYIVAIADTVDAESRIYRSSDRGDSWEDITDTISVELNKVNVFYTDENIVYAIGGEGGCYDIYFSSNSGNDWEKISGFYCISWGWVFKPSNYDTDVLYLSNVPGGIGPPPDLHRSTDGGASWDSILAGVFKFDCAPSNPNVIYTYTCRSSDGGASWDTIFPPPIYLYDPIVVDPFDENCVYFRAHYTTNGGESFTANDTVESLGNTVINSANPANVAFVSAIYPEVGDRICCILMTADYCATLVRIDLPFEFVTQSITAAISSHELSTVHPDIDFLYCASYYGVSGVGLWRMDISSYLLDIESEQTTMYPELNEISAYPNPFNSSCKITAPLGARIEVFNLSGQKISIPHSLGILEGISKRHVVVWQPDKSADSGIYLVRAVIEDKFVVKRIIYIK